MTENKVNWNVVIASVEKMLDKEISHLSFLEKHKAPLEFIDRSENYIRLYKKRIIEYRQFSEKENLKQ